MAVPDVRVILESLLKAIPKVDPNQGSLFNRPQLHPEVKTVHEKSGKTHQQRYHVKTEPASASPNRVTGDDLTLMSMIKRFSTVEAARLYFERVRWPDGRVCPHCGSVHSFALTANVKTRTRPGLYKCADCREKFTVTVGTVMEASHIPLNKWLLAFYMMAASKTQVAALQLQRQLELGSYATALFMCHRIRFALSELFPADKLTGTVEMDETYIGGKAHRHNYMANKTPVVSMIERDGRVRSRVVDKVTGKLITALLDENVDRSAHLNTDENAVYTKPGREYASHDTVTHADKEYSRYDADTGRMITTNTAEGYFGNTKNSIRGTHHAISPQHTELYMSEMDQKYNTRKLSDGQRAVLGIETIEGKRLTREQMYNRRNIMPKPMNKAVAAIREDEFRMPEDEFDRIMGLAMQQPAPDDDTKEPPFKGLPIIFGIDPKKIKYTAPVVKALPLYLGGLEQPKDEPVAKGKSLRLNFYRNLEKPQPVITAADICGFKKQVKK